MHKISTKLFLTLFLALALLAPSLRAAEAIDESELGSKLPHLLGTNNVGKKFMLTLPPPYEEVAGDNFMRIFVISAEETVVTMKNDLGYFTQNKINPYQLLAIDISASVAVPYTHNPSNKVRPAAIYPGKGMQIESGSPIVVYVIARFKYTSDGYLALPVNGLGKEYIAATIHELNWSSGQRYPPWVSVVGVYDNTTVNLTMGGSTRALSQMKTEDGKTLKAGDKYKFTLNKGDVFLGGADGLMADLSGTKIQANKPVSFITAHFCNQIPNGTPACDYSVEMPFPSSTWGKMYLIPALPHRKNSGLVTIMAKEPNTKVYRDGKYFCTIKIPGGNDDSKSAYFYDRLWSVGDYPSKQAVITADKPISIMYFNPGGTDDNVATDPFWMTITPIEQYQSQIAFCTPNAAGGERYSKNFLNFTFECDENQLMPEDLEWALLDVNEPKWIPANSVFTSAVNYYYKDQTDPNAKTYGFVVVSLPGEGVFGLRSKSGEHKFSAYSYGDADWDSYGYPTAAALADLEVKDTMKPRPEYIVTCDGNVNPEITKVTDYPYPIPAEERSNMSEMYMINDSSFNYEFIEGEIISGETITTNWGLKLLDPSKSGRAMIRFVDRAGNDTVITITYEAIKWEIRADHDYGQFKIGDAPVTYDFEVQNMGKGPMVLKELKLLSQKGYQGFKLEPLTWSLSTPFNPQEKRPFSVTFTADNNLPAQNIFEDIIQAMDTCLLEPKEIKVRANTGAPRIEVSDAKFMTPYLVGQNSNKQEVIILNSGNADLKVTGVTLPVNYAANYTIDWNGLNSFASPVTIAPGDQRSFYVTFSPSAVQTFPDNIVFQSDAGTYIDNVCELYGEGILPLLQVNGYDWPFSQSINRASHPKTEVASKNDVDNLLPITIINLGTANATITGMGTPVVTKNSNSSIADVLNSFFLKDPSTNEIISLNDWQTRSYPTKTLQPNETQTLPAFFNPVAIGEMEVKIPFKNTAGEDIVATLSGKGKAPSVKITPLHNFGKTIVGDVANPNNPDTDVIIEAFGGEYSEEVTIEGIVTTPTISNDFTQFNGMPFIYDNSQIKVGAKLVPGIPVTIPAKFVATSVGANAGTLELKTDAVILAERPDFNNWISTWNGVGSVKGWNVSGGSTSICVEGNSTIDVKVTNTGDEPILIKSITLGANAMFLTWQNGNPSANITLAGYKDTTFTLNFNPLADLASTNVDVTVETDDVNNPTKTATVNISAYSSKANSSSRINAATVIYGDKPFTYTIKYEPVDDVSKSNVTEFNVSIDYNDEIIKPVLNNSSVNDPSKFTLKLLGTFATNFEIVNPAAIVPTGTGYNKQISFTIKALGANTLDNNSQDLLELKFKAYLPSYDPNNINSSKPNTNIVISHQLADVLTDKCFIFDQATDATTAITEICAADIRPLVLGTFLYSLQSINPNPVDASGADINFSNAFSENVQLNILDENGNIVSELLNNTLEAGEHTVRIPIEKLSSGVYFYQIKAGAYQETKNLVIRK